MQPIINTHELAAKAGVALGEMLRDGRDEIQQDAERIFRNTEDEKAPVLTLSFSLRVDLRTGGVSFKLSGGSKFQIANSEQLELFPKIEAKA